MRRGVRTPARTIAVVRGRTAPAPAASSASASYSPAPVTVPSRAVGLAGNVVPEVAAGRGALVVRGVVAHRKIVYKPRRA
jgi:hypothetical protein